MNTLYDVRLHADKLLNQHNLTQIGWIFQWDNAKRRLGCCRHRSKTISLAKPLVELILKEDYNSRFTKINDVILHEIAHALVGKGHGHDAVWRAKAIEIGCDGQRCYDYEIPIEHRYIGKCPNGHVHKAHRAPKKITSCAKCSPRFDRNYLITYTDTKVLEMWK